jgi:RND family efflux transporter MFP subunit
MNRRLGRSVLIAAAVSAVGCGGEEPGRLPRPQEPAQVALSRVEKAAVLESFPATIVSELTAEVATRTSGHVERVTVEVGSTVLRGDPLVTLDATDVHARVAAARAQEVLAERTFRRVDNLAGQGAASRQERDEAEARLDGARAARVEAEAQLAYTVVRAPFDGVVTGRSVDRGDLALPGQALVTMVAPGSLKIVADVPARRAGSLRLGASVQIRYAGGVAAALVTRVVPAIGESSRTFKIEARFQGVPVDALAGTYARLEMARPGERARWIPVDAVVRKGQLTGVYTVESDTVRLRWVRLGQGRGDAVELLSGPEGHLLVVRRPDPELYDGRPVGGVQEEGWAPVQSVAVLGAQEDQ